VSDTPYLPRTLPVSVKGVAIRDGQMLLLCNERDEWELPGGKIEIGETPEECLAREIEEETGWPVQMAEILDSWIYHITQVDRHVSIVTYGCRVDSRPRSWSPANTRRPGCSPKPQCPTCRCLRGTSDQSKYRSDKRVFSPGENLYSQKASRCESKMGSLSCAPIPPRSNYRSAQGHSFVDVLVISSGPSESSADPPISSLRTTTISHTE
jgi:ADP-ribose pyrophosphatase YjhB (NUDIX family)